MENHTYQIYKDIQSRTKGAVYLGVVGPVRTGKSTFIKRFMDVLVLPNVTEPHIRQQINDELPQSGNGKTIMKEVITNTAILNIFTPKGCLRILLIYFLLSSKNS